MRAAVAAVALLAAVGTAARAAPVITVKGRTAISLDPVHRGYDGAVVRGQLVDKFSREPVAYARLELRMDYQSRSAWTDADGNFSATFDVYGGTHDLVIEYAGDTHRTSTSFEMSGFDVDKEPLELSVRSARAADVGDEEIEIAVKAWTPSGGVRVPVEVLAGDGDADDEDLVHLGRPFTDESGHAALRIPGVDLAPAGRKRVLVRFEGDDAFNETSAETDLLLTTDTSTQFRLADAELSYESDVRGSGTVVDAAGTGIESVPVVMTVGTKRVAESLTDEDGTFGFEVPASELGAGTHNVQVAAEPSKSWRRTSRSTPAQITVAEPQPVPVGYTVAAFAATLGAMLAFLGLRTRPWERWLARLRREEDQTGESATGQEPPPVHTGLAEARPGLVSTLRRAHEHAFSGAVRNAVTTRPVPGARLRLDHPQQGEREAVADSRGQFELDDLGAGEWTVSVAAPGYCTEEFAITMPHRGELRGARVDLLSVRERIFSMYRDAAEPLLPDASLWGIWTPRQIFDHVRQGNAPAWARLTDFVEEAYFSQRTPHEQALHRASERIADARREAPVS